MMRWGLIPYSGIWERRRDEDGSELLSNALITMPAVLLEEHHAAWLNGSPEEATAALVEYPSADMVAWQVSRTLYANKTPDNASLLERVSRE
jgi:putative SOS response-associated peptidase YedK